MTDPTNNPIPPDDDEEKKSKIGTDEWVSQVDDRVRGRSGVLGRLVALWEAIPESWRYTGVLLLVIAFPVISGTDAFLELFDIGDNAFILRTGVRFLTFAILAIGLNVVVGYAGLLDLGYIAFMGIAGYLYAYMSSEFVQIEGLIPYGLAIPSIVSIPLIVLIVAGIGYLIGSVSIRLAGDYLAIVTLGFGQVFIQLALTATRVSVPGFDRPVDLTRGPNGINNLDDITLFGYTFESTMQYYYLFLLLLIIVFVVVNNINRSRIGRAWRAVREDELAAEVMGTPTRRMKLLAFAIGAGIAALAGAVDAAFQGNVVPNPRYSVLTLINLYAMVVLGGTGSLIGSIVGAFIFTILPELLRNIAAAGVLFYGVGIIGLYAALRPWRRFALVMGGTLVGGLLLKLIVPAINPAWDNGFPEAGSVLNQIVQGWLVIPENFQLVGNIVTGLAIFFLLAAMFLRQRQHLFHVLLGLAIYSFAFSWETRLAVEPSATRILVVGATLVVLMVARPQGLLGKTEVKII
ncbi:MAG: branched-chain amino acid ABC transporter permease [Ardenticatenaceae bacterium]|nr:branched-chain amino acid ABC transporter permease [Ardenticatenaceae bacterium]